MPDTIYDVAVIGSGPAGYTAAIRAGQYGLKTAIIEKDTVPWRHLPARGLHSHQGVAVQRRNLGPPKRCEGIRHRGRGRTQTELDRGAGAQDQDRDKHAKGLQFLMRKNKVETVKGFGKLTGHAQNGVHTIEVKDGGKISQLKTKNIILAMGSEARMIPGLQPDDRILTNIEILKMGAIPKSLVIVGSGAVGVEFASIFKSFDTEVTILEMLPRMVPVEDEEVSKELARSYRKRGINFFGGAKVEKVEKTKAGVSVTFSADGKQQKIEAEKILIAIGRKPYTDDVGSGENKRSRPIEAS